MHKLAELCVKRPVFATVLILSLVVVGIFAYAQLGVDRFPNVDFPFVTISTRLVGAAPEEIETEITDKIEEAVNTISGIDQLISISSEGISVVTVQFVLEKDGDVAAQEVRDRVNTVLRDLPTDADPPLIEKIDPDASPVLSIALSGPAPDPRYHRVRGQDAPAPDRVRSRRRPGAHRGRPAAADQRGGGQLRSSRGSSSPPPRWSRRSRVRTSSSPAARSSRARGT